jgi:AcrR family transcriptional regulator
MKRAESTAATRSAIIAAARELLAEQPQFALEAVATRAGVTRVTVYNQVRSRHGLFDAVLTELTERAGMDQLLTRSRDLAPRDARSFLVAETCRFWHAERAVLRPLFGLAALDPAVAENLARREGWRRAQLARLLDRLGEPPVPRADALAGMVAVTSFPAYDGLGAAGDDPDRAAAIVARLVTALTKPASPSTAKLPAT